MISSSLAMDKGQDFMSRMGGEGQNVASDNFMGGDPFADGTDDLLDKFLAEDAIQNNGGGLGDSQVLMSANDSSFQAMLDSALNKSANSINYDMPKAMDEDMVSNNMTAPAVGMSSMANQPLNLGLGNSGMRGGLDGTNWMQRTSQGASSAMNPPQNSMLDAAPLDITLGGSGLGRSTMQRSSLGASTLGSSTLGPSSSSGNLTSTLRRKSSSSQMSATKLNAVRKVNLTASKLKNTKSEGMLARALKARYNSGNSLNKYNVNAATASAVINGRLPRNAVSAIAANGRLSSSALAQHLAQSSSNYDINAVEKEGTSGGKNATWGATSSTKPGSSMFASLLTGSGSSSMQNQGIRSSASAASLLRSQGSGSRSSMQDLLRLSKKQSKTQTMLRQSSAQNLRKQGTARPPDKVDLRSLLPPQHAAMASSTGKSSTSPLLNNMQSAPQAPSAMSSVSVDTSLLHQSCRLYPTTAAVVESALRIDPEAVRKAVAVPLEKGHAKKPENVYGYPINIAMTHGGSFEVIKMLAEAAPDVLVQKDGNDGSGSLGIALTHKADMNLIDMLVQTNPECARVADRRANYPLHVAVSQGLNPDIVKRLHEMYPTALQMRNFHSQTPLDIAQRSTRCPEEIMNYLQSVAFSPLESTAHHMGSTPANLEDGLDDIMETNV